MTDELEYWLLPETSSTQPTAATVDDDSTKQQPGPAAADDAERPTSVRQMFFPVLQSAVFRLYKVIEDQSINGFLRWPK